MFQGETLLFKSSKKRSLFRKVQLLKLRFMERHSVLALKRILRSPHNVASVMRWRRSAQQEIYQILSRFFVNQTFDAIV